VEVDVGDAVECGVGAGRLESRSGGIDGFDRLRMRGEVKGEAAGGREAIERASAAAVAGCGFVVLALVEIDAGFLAVL